MLSKDKLIDRLRRMLIATLVGILCAKLLAGDTYSGAYVLLGYVMFGSLFCNLALPVTWIYRMFLNVLGQKRLLSLIGTIFVLAGVWQGIVVPIIDKLEQFKNGEILFTILLTIASLIQIWLVIFVYKKEKISSIDSQDV